MAKYRIEDGKYVVSREELKGIVHECLDEKLNGKIDNLRDELAPLLKGLTASRVIGKTLLWIFGFVATLGAALLYGEEIIKKIFN